MTETNFNAKAVYFNIAGQECQIVVFNHMFSLFLEGLLQKVFKTVRTIDIEWPDAEAIYKQARQEIEADINLSHPDYDIQERLVNIHTVWCKSLTKERSIVVAKAVVDGDMKTLILRKKDLSFSKGSKIKALIRAKGKINLLHWM